LAFGGGIWTGVLHVRPSSVERFTKTVGTLVSGSSGIDDTSQTLCLASYATLASLTRSKGLPAAPELKVIPGRNELLQVWPPSPERATPMSTPPPSKTRATWKAPTTVEPCANVSGSTSVAWLTWAPSCAGP
jgi:hypothetical protein